MNTITVNTTLFQAIYLTLSDTMASFSSYCATTVFMDGLAALKYAYDNYGPGSGATQISRQFGIISEKQKANETPQEFGTRLQTLNATLDTPTQDSMMKQIFVRGLNNKEAQTFLVREMTSKTMTFQQLVNASTDLQIQQNMVDGIEVDGIFFPQNSAARSWRQRMAVLPDTYGSVLFKYSSNP